MQPSALAAPQPATVSLEGESGYGDGQVRQRSRASGGETVDLGPGERRVWTLDVRAAAMPYALSVTYSNGKEGENEVISVSVDGVLVSSFENRDSGDAIEGWNLFVTDPVGTSVVGPTTHTLTLDVRGGDGCVEIDKMTFTPASAQSTHTLIRREEAVTVCWTTSSPFSSWSRHCSSLGLASSAIWLLNPATAAIAERWASALECVRAARRFCCPERDVSSDRFTADAHRHRRIPLRRSLFRRGRWLVEGKAMGGIPDDCRDGVPGPV